MALLGKAALAMWWEIDPPVFDEFAHWHAHEHFPERLGIPGFRRASRWTQVSGGHGVFVMYELDGHDVLSSAPYLERLNSPSPWSLQTMPWHHRMVRSQCEVLFSHGALTAKHALTVRLSPAHVAGIDGLRNGLQDRGRALFSRPGLTGAHLLRHRRPAIAQTTEEKIRGGDAMADWVLVVTGYDPAAIHALAHGEFSLDALLAMGASDISHGLYALAYAAVPADML